MSDAKKAKLDVIDDVLESDETVTVEVLALLFDPGGDLKKREAEGWLVLTNRRLIFGTAAHGILIDLPMEEIRVPITVTDKFMSTRLLVKPDNGPEHTVVLNRSSAREIARTLNEAAAK